MLFVNNPFRIFFFRYKKLPINNSLYFFIISLSLFFIQQLIINYQLDDISTDNKLCKI